MSNCGRLKALGALDEHIQRLERKLTNLQQLRDLLYEHDIDKYLENDTQADEALWSLVINDRN